MRLALISDIHANLVALDAVLGDIERRGVDALVCLGDICDLGPEPAETLARVRGLGCPVIAGNHDPFHHDEPAPPELQAIMRWCEAELGKEELAYLRALPLELHLDLGHGVRLHCVHGSPRGFSEGIVAEQTREELSAILDGVTADIIVAGHTHVPLLRRLDKLLVVNVGSVGCPFERTYDGAPVRVLPWSEYAVIETSPSGPSVQFLRVAFDVRELVHRILRSSMPGASAWADQWARRSFMPEMGPLSAR